MAIFILRVLSESGGGVCLAGLAVVEVPQWQGSSSPAALGLVDGARVLAGLLPPARRVPAQVTTSPGSGVDGVKNADVLAANLAAVRAALREAGALTAVVAGGDCGVELAPIETAICRYGERLAVIWLDAHGDLHTPASSPSGAFHGMVLRALLGEGPGSLRPLKTLAPQQIVLAGARALDPAEREFVRRHRIRLLGAADVTTPSSLVEAAAATGAEAIYLHVDLDVLGPEEFGAVGVPEPGGLTVSQLTAAVRALAGRFIVAGAGITEFQPRGPADQAKLAPLTLALADAAAAAPPSEIAEIEEHAVAAWPAVTTVDTGGWLLRHTPGMSRLRANNAALPRSPEHRPGQRLAQVEAFYAERGLPVAVQVTPAAQHEELDRFLDSRGYRHDTPIEVLTAPAAGLASPGRSGLAAQVNLADEPTSAWRAAFSTLDGHPDSITVAGRVISSIRLPAAYASVSLNGQPAGIGLLAGGHGPWGGVYCMVTHPGFRRRGIGSAILAAGARWALDHGIERLYLQVEQANQPARRMYGAAGFSHFYSYHYRIGGDSHR
jgi:arginase family enzyme/GNAT superfamily N-acetyltransferase